MRKWKQKVQVTYSESLQVIDAEVVTEEVEESILEHATVSVAKARKGQWTDAVETVVSVDLREDETVTVQPVGVLGVEVHELVEQDVGNGSHSPVTTMSVCILIVQSEAG